MAEVSCTELDPSVYDYAFTVHAGSLTFKQDLRNELATKEAWLSALPPDCDRNLLEQLLFQYAEHSINHMEVDAETKEYKPFSRVWQFLPQMGGVRVLIVAIPEPGSKPPNRPIGRV